MNEQLAIPTIGEGEVGEKLKCVWCEAIIKPIEPDDNSEPQQGIDYEVDKTGSYFCYECISTHNIRFCYDCGKGEAEDDGDFYEDEFYCEACFSDSYSRCSACDDVCPQDFMSEDPRGDFRCSDCFSDHCGRCSDCGDICWNDDLRWDDNSDDQYCSDCYRAQSRPIQDASYEPAYILLRAKGEPDIKVKPLKTPYRRREPHRYFGFELEVEAPNSCNNRENDAAELNCDWLFCKHDGSLNYGFEICSHPFTWKWMHENKKAFEPIFNLRQLSYRSFNTHSCGLHVHVSLKSISELQLYKLMKLIYQYPDFTYALSRRHSRENLSNYASCTECSNRTMLQLSKTKRGVEKYLAINLTHSNTMEIRIFRGTLKPESFFANIEAVQAMLEYAKSEAINKVTPSGFFRMVTENRKEYPNLANLIRTLRYFGYNRLHQDQEGDES